MAVTCVIDDTCARTGGQNLGEDEVGEKEVTDYSTVLVSNFPITYPASQYPWDVLRAGHKTLNATLEMDTYGEPWVQKNEL